MVLAFLAGPYGQRLLNTVIAVVVIAVCIAVAVILFKRKFKGKRERSRFRSRMIYLSVVIFLLVMIRVWVEGFTHLFTMLSLVAAGLVVSNKENIMNLTGWLIINWRGVFSEGDCIQIQNTVGCIESIRLLYKVYETTSIENGRFTGKVVKVPNGLIIANPITLFTRDRHFFLKQIT